MKSERFRSHSLTLFLFFIFANFFAFGSPSRTTYQAKIVKPDGYPLEALNVSFKFSILDPSGSCILYAETYSSVNMSGSGGLISFALGSGIKTYPASSTTFSDVFSNQTASLSCDAGGPGNYAPVATDNRKIVMQFNDGGGWQTLPSMGINAVPYAMYAGKSIDSKTLNGKADTAFVENATLAALGCNPSTHAITFNGVSFSCIPVSSGSVTSVTTSGSVLFTAGTSAAPVISITAATMSQSGYLTSLDYAEFKAKLSVSSTQIINTLGYAPVSGAAVTSQIAASNLSGDVSGTFSSNSVITVGGKSSAQISTSVNETLAAAASATVNTIVKRDASGNSSFSGLSANTASLNYVDIYKPSSSFNIRLQAPTSLSANYTLNLPTTSGTTGQVLSTDGSGNLSWINSATGSVTSVSGTTNEITSTGGSTPALSLANTGTIGTYFKVTTDSKGRVTSGATNLTLTDLPASVLSTTSTFSGDISGMIANITVNRIQGVSVTITSLTTNDILQYDGSNYINKNIPTCSGSQYLTFNGVSFSCFADAGASGTITTLSVTGPISSTGGSNPTLSIAQANTSTNGYLSSVDWNTFSNKQNATSSAIIATLGYMPADSAVSGTYLQKANNLSDLANAATARSNLGLGTFATANNVDLGSASATGTLATARLPSFSGDATIAAASNTIILSNSGVTAGTYTKVTVDGKGRVTSSSALSSSDVTTALGYTPANATSGVTSLNGLTTQTQTFAVGITGTNFAINSAGSNHTFNLPLAASSSVIAGLLSNTDYLTFSNKQNATSSAIIATLGYTPADSAVSGAYLQKANNLSDLTNTALARTNLGLGSLAVGNSIDLGSASATGIIADARLVNQANVTSGTQYTKVTVDGKGRITSGTQLSLSDVTAALGYTPLNATSAVTSLNGSTSQTQTFANSSTGTQPSYTTVNGVHTLNIPLASAGSVTAGLLSNADYTTFTNKITSSATSISQVLGYAPVSSTTLGNYLAKANNLSDLVSSSTARTNLGVGYIGTLGSVDLSSADVSGTLTIARTPAYVGDVTKASASNTLILSNSGVTAGTYTKLTVDAKGRVTSSSALASSDLTTALGYTPAQASSATQWTTSGSTISYNSGNVGVGTTTPTQKFENAGGRTAFGKDGANRHWFTTNTGTSEPNNIAFGFSASGGTVNNFTVSTSGAARLEVNSVGNVGIGTTAPGSVPNWTAPPQSRVLEISGDGSASNSSEGILLLTNNRATAAVNDELGAIGFGHKNNAGNFPGVISSHLTGAGGANGFGGTLDFYTKADNVAGHVQRMRIDSSGNVGIGTTSPAADAPWASPALDISGSRGTAIIRTTAVSGIATLKFTGVASANDLHINYRDNTGTLTFDQQAGVVPNVLALTKSGNVGIGTATPTTALHVASAGVIGWNSVIKVETTATNAHPLIMYRHGGADTGYVGFGDGGATNGFGVYNYLNADLTLGTSSTTMMTFKPSGNIGIGTANPLAKLHVSAGDVWVTGSGEVGAGFNTVNTSKTALNQAYRWTAWNMTGSYGNKLGFYGYSQTDACATGLCINPFSIYDNGNIHMTGAVGIGTATPGYTLHVVGTAGLSTGTAWTNASDRRLKDIQGDYEYGLNEVLKLHTVRYNYKKDNALGLPSDFSKTGFIAQEVQKVIPDAVNVRKDGYLELNVDPIHWAVVNAVKDLYKLVVESKNEILGEVRGLASVVESKADKAEVEVLKQKAAKVDKLEAENAELKNKAKEFDALKAYLCSKDPNAPICK